MYSLYPVSLFKLEGGEEERFSNWAVLP